MYVTLITISIKLNSLWLSPHVRGEATSHLNNGVYTYIFYCIVLWYIVLYCIVVGSRRLIPPDALQPKAYCTIPGL